MDCIEKIADFFRLEIKQRFKVLGYDEKFYFSSFDFCRENENGESLSADRAILGRIMLDPTLIMSKEFKPKPHETFYYIKQSLTDCWSIVKDDFSYFSAWDLALYKMGNCFATEDDAYNNAKEILKKFEKIRDELKGNS